MMTVWMLLKGPGAELDATGTILMMTLFSVVTIALFLYMKWTEVSRHWVQTRPWLVLFGVYWQLWVLSSLLHGFRK